MFLAVWGCTGSWEEWCPTTQDTNHARAVGDPLEPHSEALTISSSFLRRERLREPSHRPRDQGPPGDHQHDDLRVPVEAEVPGEPGLPILPRLVVVGNLPVLSRKIKEPMDGFRRAFGASALTPSQFHSILVWREDF